MYISTKFVETILQINRRIHLINTESKMMKINRESKLGIIQAMLQTLNETFWFVSRVIFTIYLLNNSR